MRRYDSLININPSEYMYGKIEAYKVVELLHFLASVHCKRKLGTSKTSEWMDRKVNGWPIKDCVSFLRRKVHLCTYGTYFLLKEVLPRLFKTPSYFFHVYCPYIQTTYFEIRKRCFDYHLFFWIFWSTTPRPKRWSLVSHMVKSWQHYGTSKTKIKRAKNTEAGAWWVTEFACFLSTCHKIFLGWSVYV